MHRDLPRSSFRWLSYLDRAANRVYTSRHNPLYHSGAIAVALLILLIVTGVYLLLFYRIGSPHESVASITEQAWSGRWIRGLHRFASDAVIMAAAIHAFRMYAQRRTWGPRALAWISGVILVGGILVSGWTGYVLVWDSHALLLASEGARFLDALPIFSEPIARSFVGESALPSGFFFLNLFIHIALPLSLGLIFWLHVGRLSRPVLMPTRRVLYASLIALTALALLWPLDIAPQADPFALPTRIPLDLFYGFWLPFSQRVPVPVTFGVAIATSLLLIVIPWLTRPRATALPAPATVNERICTACEQCVHDCPYDAIEMVTREGDGRLVARVKTELCTSCGICVGSCPPMAIGPGLTARGQLADVRTFLAEHKPSASDVVIVGCTWSAARAEAEATGALFFPLPCIGTMHSSTVEMILRGGAGGVLVAGCIEHDGRTREGVTWAQERLYDGRKADLKPRVDRRRVRLAQTVLTDQAGLHAAVIAFAEDISALKTGDEDEVDVVALCKACQPQEASTA
jgi:ferredoxin/coenzyme F420-reducing hydrogenase delta subunit